MQGWCSEGEGARRKVLYRREEGVRGGGARNKWRGERAVQGVRERVQVMRNDAWRERVQDRVGVQGGRERGERRKEGSKEEGCKEGVVGGGGGGGGGGGDQTWRVCCLTDSWIVLPVASTVLPASSRMRGVGLEGAWNLAPGGREGREGGEGGRGGREGGDCVTSTIFMLQEKQSNVKLRLHNHTTHANMYKLSLYSLVSGFLQDSRAALCANIVASVPHLLW